MSSLQRITLEKRLPSKLQAPGVGLSRQLGLKVPRSPHTSSHPNYTQGTPDINNCGGQSVDFLLDTRATFSVLTEAPGPLSSQSTTIMGLSGQAKCCYFSHPLSHNWDFVLYSHKFLITPVLSHPFWGGIYWTRSRPLFSQIWNLLFLIEQNVNHRVRADEKTVGWTQNAVPVFVLFHFNKTLLCKISWVIKPSFWSQS